MIVWVSITNSIVLKIVSKLTSVTNVIFIKVWPWLYFNILLFNNAMGIHIIYDFCRFFNASNENSKNKNFYYDHFISNALKNANTRKNLEASYIALWKSDLKEQKDSERLVLCRNGVTKSN